MSVSPRALAGLRQRQWRAASAYWLGVLGLETRPGLGGRLYTVYFAVFACGWLAYAWIDLLQAGVAAGAALPLTRLLAQALPTTLGVGQAVLMAALMGSAAVRLSWPDRNWLVTLPLPAWVFVADAWAGLVRGVAVVAVLAASVVAAMLGHGVVSVLPTVVAGLADALVTVSLALVPAAVARSSRRRPGLAWVLPPLWAGCVVLVPALRLPGRALVAVASSAPLLPWLGSLALWVALTALALFLAGRRLNLTWASEDSRVQAERQSLAWLSWTDPAAARTYLAAGRMARGRPRGRLAAWNGLRVVLAHQMLGWLRRPSSLLVLVEFGLEVWSGLWIAFAPGTGPAWVPWLVAVLAAGRRSLVALVWGGGRSPFVDQLLPWRHAHRLWAELTLPAGVATLAAWVAWVAHPASVGVWAGIAAAPALALLLLVAAAGDAAFPAWRGRLGPGLVSAALVAVVLVGAAAWRDAAATTALLVLAGAGLVLWLERCDAAGVHPDSGIPLA